MRNSAIALATEVLREQGWVLFGNNTWKGRVVNFTKEEVLFVGGNYRYDVEYLRDGQNKIGVRLPRLSP